MNRKNKKERYCDKREREKKTGKEEVDISRAGRGGRGYGERDDEKVENDGMG